MKILGWVIGLVVAAVAAVVAYLLLNSDSLIESGIEQYGSDYLGADVSVAEVSLQLADGTARIRSLEVGNPTGFDGPYALRLSEVELGLDLENVGSDLVVVRNMRVDSASVAAVARAHRTNFQQLLANLNDAAGAEEGVQPGVVGENGAEPRFIVDHFEFTNADVSLTSDLLGETALDIPDIKLSGIGRKTNGATALELTRQILGPISAAISRAAVSEGVQLEGVKQHAAGQLLERLDSGLQSLKDKFRE
jgi:hypothetical protein